jgi:hypothetical protein
MVIVMKNKEFVPDKNILFYQPAYCISLSEQGGVITALVAKTADFIINIGNNRVIWLYISRVACYCIYTDTVTCFREIH